MYYLVATNLFLTPSQGLQSGGDRLILCLPQPKESRPCVYCAISSIG